MIVSWLVCRWMPSLNLLVDMLFDDGCFFLIEFSVKWNHAKDCASMIILLFACVFLSFPFGMVSSNKFLLFCPFCNVLNLTLLLTLVYQPSLSPIVYHTANHTNYCYSLSSIGPSRNLDSLPSRSCCRCSPCSPSFFIIATLVNLLIWYIYVSIN